MDLQHIWYKMIKTRVIADLFGDNPCYLIVDNKADLFYN